MKKLPYKISVSTIMLITVLFAGCKKMPSLSVDTREETKKLGSTVVKKGTIVDMTFVSGHDFTQIKFSDGEVILSGYHWKNKKDMRIGQTGILFVSNNHDNRHCHCYTCWWSWKVTTKRTQEMKKAEFFKRADEIHKRRKAEAWMERANEIVDEEQKADIIEGDWQRVNQIKNLEANELVLIKMEDDKIAIGFITYDKQWKLGMNKDKYHHGATLTNVSKWKRINLE